jgi:hypothetical protein
VEYFGTRRGKKILGCWLAALDVGACIRNSGVPDEDADENEDYQIELDDDDEEAGDARGLVGLGEDVSEIEF